MSCQLTQRLSLLVGCTFLYLSSLVRPGYQIDQIMNAGQRPLGESPFPPPGLQGGPARPTVVFYETGFWAQSSPC